MLTELVKMEIKLLTVFFLAGLTSFVATYEEDYFHHHYRRSPHKKHRIIVEETPPSLPSPPPQQTEPPVIVEHHYHPYPPPPDKGVRIEFAKGKVSEQEKSEEIKEALEKAKAEIERDKQEKVDKLKGEVEDKLEFFATIPEKFASDLELIGRKIKEDLDKHEDKGVSIEIWKNKGGKGGHRRREENSKEVIHHYHHTYPPPSPPPSKKPNENKFADIPTKFISFLESASNQYRAPPSSTFESESSHSPPRQYGKGFQISIWKPKGWRRR